MPTNSTKPAPTPYSYLDGESAHTQFELTDEGHADPYRIPVTDAEGRMVDRIAEENVIISLHDHPVHLPKDITEYYEYTHTGAAVLDYEGLSESPLDCVFTAPLGVDSWDSIIDRYGKMFADISHQESLTKCETVANIRELAASDSVGIVATVESSSLIQNDIDKIDVLYGLGLRSMGITYSNSNALGSGLGEKRDAGLTEFGEKAVERMNQVGILIDLSHASNLTTLDVAEITEDPIILSHNGAQAIHDIDRLDPDESLQAVAETGGLVGIQAAPHTTVSRDHPRHSIHSFMDHFEYVVDLVGIDHVAFGPDVNRGDHVGLHKFFDKDMDQFPDWVETEISNVKGMENVLESWDNILRWLVKNDYSEEDIAKVAGGNILRVIEEVW